MLYGSNPHECDATLTHLRLTRRPESHLTPNTFAVALKSRGVLIAPFVEGTVRAVTHVNVSAEDVTYALRVVSEVLKEAEAGCDVEAQASVKSPYGEW